MNRVEPSMWLCTHILSYHMERADTHTHIREKLATLHHCLVKWTFPYEGPFIKESSPGLFLWV